MLLSWLKWSLSTAVLEANRLDKTDNSLEEELSTVPSLSQSNDKLSEDSVILLKSEVSLVFFISYELLLTTKVLLIGKVNHHLM